MSDVPTCGPHANFSVHLASSAVTPAGSVHKSSGDNVGAAEEMRRVCGCYRGGHSGDGCVFGGDFCVSMI